MKINGGTIGEISVNNENVEWTIEDIFSYESEDVYYFSHDFDISGCKWYFKIYPYGDTESEYGNCSGWISLYLRRSDSTNPPFAATYCFGVKKVDGIVEEIGGELNWFFENDDTGYGNPSFLLRSELLKRKSEIAPSGTITFTCNLRLTESLNTESTYHFGSAMKVNNETIGEISVKNDNVEWTIEDIFSYQSEDVYYFSHDFHISGCKWYFKIYPYGDTESEYGNCSGWISLYLRRSDSTNPPSAATYRFGVKKVDGIVEEIGGELIWFFENDGTGYGNPTFLLREELLKRMSEIAPSGTITFTCTLRLTESLNISEGLDTLSQDLVDMFISERGCDVTLKVKSETFPVHKAILSARSPVFATMFEVEMKEKNTPIVDIVDCEPGAFKDFLMYLYSGRIENISSNVVELYRIADKYDMKELRSACVIFMMSHLSVENVLDVAILSHRSNEKELQSKSQIFFSKNFQEIISTVNWESLLENDWRLANKLLKKMAPNMKWEQ